jgi:cyclopropane-fatty-acyl-phospholipid synthase
VHFGQPADDYPDVAIRFADRRVPHDLIVSPRLGAGEAYMKGRIIIEKGDVMEVAQLVQANGAWEQGIDLGEPTPLRKARDKLRFAIRSFNKPGGARRNASRHYDIGNALYRLMLDEDHMQYSCGYWPREGMTLGEAQEAKLAHIAAKLAFEPGQRVLDIGCGWGGMAIYLASKCNVEVLGITLSHEQLTLANERAEAAGVAGKVRFELVDYRELGRRGMTFDRIVSVGMFEHVGVPQYETFFRVCANLLSEDGVMLLHTIGRLDGPSWTDAFTDKWIFPGGYIPALSETVTASEKVRLALTDLEILRFHYARTLREWYRRCVEHREEIVEMYDESFFRLWTSYLAGATASFESGGMVNFQLQYARSRRTLPITRGYMDEVEAKLAR